MTFKKTSMTIASKMLRSIINLLAGGRASQISAQLAEDFSIVVAHDMAKGKIKFFCPGKLPEWRARTLLTKEPETIEWLETFNASDVLWDVGANIGVYSLYAGFKGNRVLAFEPSPSNFYLLNKNIEVNHLADRVSSYCIALNDSTKLDLLYMGNTDLGGSLNTFGESLDWRGEPFTPQFKQSVLGYTIDEFIEQYKPPFPNHIKIDVDGNEDKVIDGALKTIGNSELKSILIELNTERKEYCDSIIGILINAGFTLQKVEHAEEFNDSEFSNIYNHIFVRQE